jgi:uncharacterized protein (DUF2249 family)
MKTSFEKILKDRLKNIEMPYDASAWDSLEKKLDHKKGGTTSLKWVISSLVVLTASTVGYLMYDRSSNEPAKEAITSIKSEKEVENTLDNSTIQDEKITAEIESLEESAPKKVVKTQVETNHPLETLSPPQLELKNTTSTTYTPILKDNSLLSDNKKQEDKQKEYVFHTLAKLCIGEEQTIKNEHDIDLYLVAPNGQKTKIKNYSNYNFKAENSGNYSLEYIKEGSIISSTSFLVISSDKIDFELDDEKLYSKGLPSRTLETSSYLNNLKWYLNDQLIGTNDKEIEVNLFKKGSYHVKLVGENKNGCTSTIEKQIRIDQDYNLLAADAFSPSDDNNKINTFIPYALTERNTKFNFIIIDPKDGGIVYQTNDKLKPWDGIDRRSGLFVEPNSNWIWKVTLEQPEKGEDSSYRGTIIRL